MSRLKEDVLAMLLDPKIPKSVSATFPTDLLIGKEVIIISNITKSPIIVTIDSFLSVIQQVGKTLYSDVILETSNGVRYKMSEYKIYRK